MTELPKAVRIMSATYEVVAEEAPFPSDGSVLCGQIDYDKQRIRVHKNVGPDKLLLTLMHEVMHGICEHMNVTLSEDDVDRMAQGVCMLARDNPDIFK
jgi:hypothetical protein